MNAVATTLRPAGGAAAKLSPQRRAIAALGRDAHWRYPMLAVNLTGTKEIVVYVIVIVVVLIAAVWYSRGRSRS